MSANRSVFFFVLISFFIYLAVSIASVIFHFSLGTFDNVNLVSELFPQSPINRSHSAVADTAAAVVVEEKVNYDFNLYHQAKTITNFNTNTTSPSLESFMMKLFELKSGKKKRKIRIAYFGDSMIEGDLLTQTFRKLLQQYFGGSGVGFVPVDCVAAGFRQTAITSASGWHESNFKKPNRDIHPSGHVFYANTGHFSAVNRDLQHVEATEKSLICGYADHDLEITYNNQSILIHPTAQLNRILLSKDNYSKVNLDVADPTLPVYGISYESASGVIVDNFSFRGITGIELAKVKDALLIDLAKNNNYDLIVFQYGVNLLFRPNDLNFNYYAKAFKPVITKFQKCFPDASMLIVSTADRAFRYNGEYHTAIGVDSLVKIQAKIAYETGASFYNQFQSMGGHDAIVDWAKRSPSLANKDYIHPNHRGAEVLANYLFEAILKDYDKYLKKQQKSNNQH
jgi:lysophospholipase L1-like esterase